MLRLDEGTSEEKLYMAGGSLYDRTVRDFHVYDSNNVSVVPGLKLPEYLTFFSAAQVSADKFMVAGGWKKYQILMKSKNKEETILVWRTIQSVKLVGA